MFEKIQKLFIKLTDNMLPALTAVFSVLLFLAFATRGLIDSAAISGFYKTYFLLAIAGSFMLVAALFAINFRYFVSLVKEDKFFWMFLFLALSVLAMYIYFGPLIVRVDKEVVTIHSIVHENTEYIMTIGSRAKAFYLFLFYLQKITPVTLETVAVVNAFLLVMKAVIIYFIMALLCQRRMVAFCSGLLFLLHPNSALLAVSPDYSLSGQVFGILSLMFLLFYAKSDNLRLFYLSLATLAFSMFLRLEMIVWIFIYAIVLQFSLSNRQRMNIKRPFYLCLLLLLPALFSVILYYLSIGLEVGGFFNTPLDGRSFGIFHYFDSFVNYHAPLFLSGAIYNIKYLALSLPLFWALLVTPFLCRRERNIIIFLVCFSVLLIFYTLFLINEHISTYHYLSQIIAFLVVLFGLIIGKLTEGFKRRELLVVLVSVFFLVFNYVNYEFWQGSDHGLLIWNTEYEIAKNYKNSLENNATIISCDYMTMFDGLLDKGRHIAIVKAEADLKKQIKHLKEYGQGAVYIYQGTFGFFRNKYSCPDDFREIVKADFSHEVIYERNISLCDEKNSTLNRKLLCLSGKCFSGKSAYSCTPYEGTFPDFPIFLYKIN